MDSAVDQKVNKVTMKTIQERIYEDFAKQKEVDKILKT